MTRNLDKTSQPLVSIILPTYNRSQTLRRSIRSVLCQYYQSIEVIVVDDCSTDNTAEVVHQLDDPRIIYIRHNENRGAAAARNSGILAAHGELIAFQDSDDEWLADKLLSQVKCLEASGAEYGAVFCGKMLYGRNAARKFGARLATHVPGEEHKTLTGDLHVALLNENFISVQTLIVKKPLLIDNMCFFDPALRCNEDWDFNIRLSKFTKFLFVERPGVVAFISNDSISTDNKRNIHSQIYIIRKNSEYFRGQKTIYIRRLGLIGQGLVRINKPKLGYRFLRKAITLDPFATETWRRLAAYALQRGLAVKTRVLRT